MKNLSGRSRLLSALAIVLTMTLLFLYYDRTRGHLAPRTREDRLQQVRDLARTRYSDPQEGRQVLTAAREFFLDYPGAHDQELKLSIAYASAAQPDADWLFVTDTVEEVALHVLADEKGVPKLQDFEKAGFHFESYYGRGGGWPTPFLVTDIDGDGSPDVLMATPGIGPSVCFLFRHTKQGWISTRLGVGVPVMGLWAFDITPHGPKAITIACLADSEYDPHMLFDVSAWQQGRLNNVLSTVIRHGWQWEHKDRDGNGVQSLRLVEYPKGEALWNATSHENILYRWDGSRFVLQSTSSKPSKSPAVTAVTEGTPGEAVARKGQAFVTTVPAPTVSENLEVELNGIEARLFEQRDYRASLQELEEMEARIGASSRVAEDKVDLRLELYYHQALCYRKLGDTRHAEVILAALQRSSPDSDWGRLATACLNGSGLPHDNLQMPYNLQPHFFQRRQY